MNETLLNATVGFTEVCYLSWLQHRDMCVDGKPYLFINLNPQAAGSPVPCLFQPTENFDQGVLVFGGQPYLQLGQGEFAQVLWHDVAGASLCARALDADMNQWQLCYRCGGAGEAEDLLLLFLLAIEDNVVNGFSNMGQLPTVKDPGQFIRSLNEIACRPMPDTHPESLAPIASALIEHLGLEITAA